MHTYGLLLLIVIQLNIQHRESHINEFISEKSTKLSQISSAKYNWPMSSHITRMHTFLNFHYCCCCFHSLEHAVYYYKWCSVQIREVFFLLKILRHCPARKFFLFVLLVLLAWIQLNQWQLAFAIEKAHKKNNTNKKYFNRYWSFFME